ncbi:dipeptide/oligopeptide/nickel ABC transporter permease/ATP-binding protein [Allobranchiibius huperziae]|uniref:Peptide/nickel transport system permease protein n=1 Tax=Allobranchiibius huperziae TaxID=1874116 RepID=A0A853DJH9_9MICO|nr:dipeptide/oligopeptide/nickel ABC transporter permease/ATP-binding protein [Allobranchiibius huperziae]NYJ74325.1 peptide/nickel transport system permease protein [Allobranchiibius huperziae]
MPGYRGGLAATLSSARTGSRPSFSLRRFGVPARIALGFVALLVLVALFSTWLTPHDPTRPGLAPVGTGPSGSYWFGVDASGRDIFSRLVAGTRRSLEVGFGAAALALIVGTALGALAATSRKVVDEVIMRLLDIVMAFPAIALAAVLIVAYGKDKLSVLIIAIGFVFAPSIARVVRANVLSQYGEDYVAAEQVIGARRVHILRRHVLRNCAAPVLVFATVMVADSIIFEASLSFIGGGLPGQAAQSSWGSVIAYGQQILTAGSWWATFFPGLLILLTVLALNILSEGISDAWAAPAAGGGKEGGAEPEPQTARFEQAQEQEHTAPELPGLTRAAARLRSTARPLPQGDPVLTVRDLHIRFADRHHGVDIVDGVDLEVRPGEVLGLVGESGSGKSLTSLTVMGLQPTGAQVSGSMVFDGQELVGMSAGRRRALMGRQIAMVYQDALSALNPAMTIKSQLAQVIKRGGTRTAADLMDLVGLDPQRTLSSYPHELSGGQRQRVVIAMALSRDPKLIIADEPTTALDVTVQAQVVQLLLRLREELGFALILVSHDLALVSEVCDRVAVMYGGRIVETGVSADVVAEPRHHYSRGLLGSVLSLEAGAARLTQIRGTVPSPADFPQGCRFADRCPLATQVCLDDVPRLTGDDDHHLAACHHPAGHRAALEEAHS